MAKITQSTKGIQDALFAEWDLLNKGEVTTQKARTVAQLATTILNSAKIELDYQRYVSGNVDTRMKKKPDLKLGHD